MKIEQYGSLTVNPNVCDGKMIEFKITNPKTKHTTLNSSQVNQMIKQLTTWRREQRIKSGKHMRFNGQYDLVDVIVTERMF